MSRSAVRRFIGLNLLALLATGVAAADSPKYTLRYRFEPGTTLHYTVGNESTIDVQVGTTSEKVSHSSESGRVLQTVRLNGDGSSVLEILIEYVNLSADNNKISWDSRSGTQPPAQFAGIEKTIGVPLMSITVAPSGAVIAAENNGKAADKAQLEATQFDLFPLLPAEPVAVGESWSEPFKVDVLSSAKLPKSISLLRTYTLKSVQNGVAEVDVKTSVLTPIQDPLEDGQLVQRTPSGTVRFSIAHGRIIERLMKLDNRVVGFQGAQSVLHVVGMRQESLQSAVKAAAAPNGPAVK